MNGFALVGGLHRINPMPIFESTNCNASKCPCGRHGACAKHGVLGHSAKLGVGPYVPSPRVTIRNDLAFSMSELDDDLTALSITWRSALG